MHGVGGIASLGTCSCTRDSLTGCLKDLALHPVPKFGNGVSFFVDLIFPSFITGCQRKTTPVPRSVGDSTRRGPGGEIIYLGPSGAVVAISMFPKTTNALNPIVAPMTLGLLLQGNFLRI